MSYFEKRESETFDRNGSKIISFLAYETHAAKENSPCHQRESEKYDSFLERLDNSSLIDDQLSSLVNLMGQVSRKEIKWIVDILSI